MNQTCGFSFTSAPSQRYGVGNTGATTGVSANGKLSRNSNNNSFSNWKPTRENLQRSGSTSSDRIMVNYQTGLSNSSSSAIPHYSNALISNNSNTNTNAQQKTTTAFQSTKKDNFIVSYITPATEQYQQQQQHDDSFLAQQLSTQQHPYSYQMQQYQMQVHGLQGTGVKRAKSACRSNFKAPQQSSSASASTSSGGQLQQQLQQQSSHALSKEAQQKLNAIISSTNGYVNSPQSTYLKKQSVPSAVQQGFESQQQSLLQVNKILVASSNQNMSKQMMLRNSADFDANHTSDNWKRQETVGSMVSSTKQQQQQQQSYQQSQQLHKFKYAPSSSSSTSNTTNQSRKRILTSNNDSMSSNIIVLNSSADEKSVNNHQSQQQQQQQQQPNYSSNNRHTTNQTEQSDVRIVEGKPSGRTSQNYNHSRSQRSRLSVSRSRQSGCFEETQQNSGGMVVDGNAIPRIDIGIQQIDFKARRSVTNHIGESMHDYNNTSNLLNVSSQNQQTYLHNQHQQQQYNRDRRQGERVDSLPEGNEVNALGNQIIQQDRATKIEDLKSYIRSVCINSGGSGASNKSNKTSQSTHNNQSNNSSNPKNVITSATAVTSSKNTVNTVVASNRNVNSVSKSQQSSSVSTPVENANMMNTGSAQSFIVATSTTVQTRELLTASNDTAEHWVAQSQSRQNASLLKPRKQQHSQVAPSKESQSSSSSAVSTQLKSRQTPTQKQSKQKQLKSAATHSKVEVIMSSDLQKQLRLNDGGEKDVEELHFVQVQFQQNTKKWLENIENYHRSNEDAAAAQNN